MLAAILLGILAFYLGHRLQAYLAENLTRIRLYPEALPVKIEKPVKEFIPKCINDELHKLSELILDKYIRFWYEKLSDSPDFIVDLKVQIQYFVAALVNLVNKIDLSVLITQDLVPIVVNHLSHIMNDHFIDPVQELHVEDLLRKLGPHLHPAMYSRHAELRYIRSIFIMVAPKLFLSPGITSSKLFTQHQKSTTATKSAESESSKAQQKQQRPRNNSHLKYDPAFSSSFFFNQIGKDYQKIIDDERNKPSDDEEIGFIDAVAFMCIDLFSGLILLPCFDILAQPDFLNKMLLLALEGDHVTLPEVDLTKEKILAPYLTERRIWIENKPWPKTRIEMILQDPETLYSLMQYLKVTNSVSLLSFLTELYECNQRLLGLQFLSKDQQEQSLCELKTALERVLDLVLQRPSETEDNVIEDYIMADYVILIPRNFVLIIKNTLAKMLQPDDQQEEQSASTTDTDEEESASNGRISGVLKLLQTEEWLNAYSIVCNEIEKYYLPLFFDSYQYIDQLNQQDIQRAEQESKKPGPSTRASSSQEPAAAAAASTSSKAQKPVNIASSSTSSGEGTSQSKEKTPVPSTSKSQQQAEEVPNPLDYFSHNDGEIDLFEWWVSIPKLSQQFIESTASSSSSQLASLASSSQTIMQTMAAFTMNPLTDMLNSGGQEEGSSSTPNIVPAKQFTFVVQTEKVPVPGKKPLPGSVTNSVSRVDRESSYQMHRKYNEFYVLEQKLQEFHGSQITVQLPPKRHMVNAKNHEYLETKMGDFERYLQYLIRQPFLRSSELIFSFLTSPEEFNTSINLSRLMKSVPMRLTKERGQNLEGFIDFLYRTCYPELYSEKSAPAEPTQTAEESYNRFAGSGGQPDSAGFSPNSKPSVIETRLRQRQYWNNAGLPDFELTHRSYEPCNCKLGYCQGSYDVICVALDHASRTKNLDVARSDQAEMYGLRNYLRSSFFGLATLLRPYVAGLVDKLVNNMLTNLLTSLLSPALMANLLGQLRETVFGSNTAKVEDDRLKRKERALKLLRQKCYASSLLRFIIPENLFEQRVEMLFNAFQQAKLNKQLFYLLLDRTLMRVFPDLAWSERPKSPEQTKSVTKSCGETKPASSKTTRTASAKIKLQDFQDATSQVEKVPLRVNHSEPRLLTKTTTTNGTSLQTSTSSSNLTGGSSSTRSTTAKRPSKLSRMPLF